MSFWNFRIVKYRGADNEHGLHEVYYDQEGQPFGMNLSLATFSSYGENPATILHQLSQALAEATALPTLEEPNVWPGKPDDSDGIS